MSSSAAVRSIRPSFLAPALQRARLQVVPRLRPGHTTARRVPFVALVSAILIGGVVGLLMFNTSMQQAAFSEQSLQQQADALAAKQEALTSRLQAMDDPQHIAAMAQTQGMVIPDSPALLRVPSGKILGQATPADGANTPPLWAANPAPHYAPTIVHAPATKTTTKSTKKSTKKSKAKTRGHRSHGSH